MPHNMKQLHLIGCYTQTASSFYCALLFLSSSHSLDSIPLVGNTCEPKGLKQPVISLNEMIKLLKLFFRSTDFEDLQLLQLRRLQMLHGTIVHPLI